MLEAGLADQILLSDPDLRRTVEDQLKCLEPRYGQSSKSKQQLCCRRLLSSIVRIELTASQPSQPSLWRSGEMNGSTRAASAARLGFMSCDHQDIERSEREKGETTVA